MALISEIRKKSWLLLILIGLGLAGFIIMDMMSNNQRAGSQLRMGSVDGKKIEWDEFQRLENTLYKNSTADVYSRRDYIWNFLVDETIVTDQSEELGLAVSKPELMELQFGANLSPVIQQRFGNQQTGQVDREQLNQIKQSIENGSMTEEVRPFWAFQEKEIVKDRLQTKITTLVAKGLYVPTWMAEMELKDRQEAADLLYVRVPYDKVDDKSVKLEDSDYAAYIREHKKQYEQAEETRKIQYAAFSVSPTAADSNAIRNGLISLMEPFRTAEKDSTFIEANNGVFDQGFYKKSDIGAGVADSAFIVSVGSVFGPVIDDGKMKIVKVTARQVIPDSVRSRHILRPARNATELDASMKFIDSLKTVIETGKSSFDSLAMRFGTDGTASKGGDLGYTAPGGMVKPYNDLIFFKAKPGKLETVITQFGVHLVEVTGVKVGKGETGVQIAQVEETIAPSEETQNTVMAQVQQVLTANPSLEALKKALEKREDVQLETSNALKQNDFALGALGASNASRDIIRWAFGPDASVGALSPEVYSFQEQNAYYVNKYVIAGLSKIISKGLPGVEDLKEEIEMAVRNQKKAAMISAKLANKDINAAAAEYGVSIDSAKAVTFASPFVAGLGNEMKVIGKGMSLAEGKEAGPIEGTAGVYMIKMLSKYPSPTASTMDLNQVKTEMTRMAQGPVASRFIQELRKDSKIKDERFNFY